MTKWYAYLLGVYLGDGSIQTDGRTFCLQAIDRDFVEKTGKALSNLSCSAVRVVELPRKTTGGNQVFAVYCSDKNLVERLKKDTDNRLHIPLDIDKWPKQLRLEFISGLLDSEGYVSMTNQHTYNGCNVFNMVIGIGATDPWLYEIHDHLRISGVKVGKITRERLKSGKIFLKFAINKRSFIAYGLFFSIERKQSRIEKYKKLFPGSTTIRGIPKTKGTKQKISQFAKKRKRDENGHFVKVVI
jgi:hypothetical protein